MCRVTKRADNDPVFGEHGKLNVKPYIQRDMLLLENQLPMLVLHTLIEVEGDQPQVIQHNSQFFICLACKCVKCKCFHIYIFKNEICD